MGPRGFDQAQGIDRTSLNDLVTQLNATGLQATNLGGFLKIDTNSPNIQFAFDGDTSGVLAAFGLNTFFSGDDAMSISITSAIEANTDLVAAARSSSPGDNTNAQRMTALRHELVLDNGSSTIEGFYEELVGKLGAESASIQDQFASQRVMTEQVLNERDAISGVSIDEEKGQLTLLSRPQSFFRITS